MAYNPERTCMGCGTKKTKSELIRVLKNKQNIINIDKTGKQEGRGAYICYNIACLEKIIKTKKIERVLNTKIDNQIYEKLRGVIVDR